MKITTINLDDELYNFIKLKSNNISRYIQALIKEKMETEEEQIKILEKKKKEIDAELDNLKNKMKEKDKKKETLIKKLTEGQKKELVESVEILNKEGGAVYFEGRYNRYKNLFGENTKEEFRELLNLFNKIK